MSIPNKKRFTPLLSCSCLICVPISFSAGCFATVQDGSACPEKRGVAATPATEKVFPSPSALRGPLSRASPKFHCFQNPTWVLYQNAETRMGDTSRTPFRGYGKSPGSAQPEPPCSPTPPTSSCRRGLCWTGCRKDLQTSAPDPVQALPK